MRKRRMQILVMAMAAACACAAAGSILQQAPVTAMGKTNPYEGDDRAARAGRKLYERDCASCHGKTGEGIGKRPPLASRAVAEASAGTLEWVLRNGSITRGMPSFSHLPRQQRWQIITYVKALTVQTTVHQP
jgi:mono/diheme cytochrome c family protein